MEAFATKHYRALALILGTLLIGLSFYLGYLQGIRQGNNEVTLACSSDVLTALTIPTKALAEGAVPQPAASGTYFGSRNGSKYYEDSCKSVTRIKSENMVWFSDEADAALQGYTKATSC